MEMPKLTGERRALSAAVFAFYGFLFLVVSLGIPEWSSCFAALAGVYGLAFFALVAGYFWARWFAIGLGLSGAISAGISLFQVGMEPTLLFYGGTHLLSAVALLGGAMKSAFDGRKEWRERFHLDESATERLGKAVIRVGVSLPYVLMYALAPKEGAGGLSILALAGVFSVGAGLWGLLRTRVWGIVALAEAAVVVAVSSAWATGTIAVGSTPIVTSAWLGLFAAGGLAFAVAPFARPMWRAVMRP